MKYMCILHTCVMMFFLLVPACGTSQNPCADTYSGTGGFSCVETQLASAAIEARSSDLDLYITIHSYGQLWLVPWGGSEDYPADYDELVFILFSQV